MELNESMSMLVSILHYCDSFILQSLSAPQSRKHLFQHFNKAKNKYLHFLLLFVKKNIEFESFSYQGIFCICYVGNVFSNLSGLYCNFAILKYFCRISIW